AAVELGAEAADQQRRDEGGDDGDEAGVLDGGLAVVTAPADHAGQGEGAAFCAVAPGELVPLTALGLEQEAEDDEREEELETATPRTGGEVGEAAEHQPDLYGDEPAPDPGPALPAAPGQPPAQDAGRSGVPDEGDDATVEGVVGGGGQEEADTAEDGERE